MTVATKYVTVEIIPETCCTCGVVFGMPDGLMAQRRKDGEPFYCPVGHKMNYPRGRHLEKQLEATRDDLARQRKLIAEERRSHSATKGHLTRTKRRANAGVCLDCKRSFTNVRRHRSNMHPEAAKA